MTPECIRIIRAPGSDSLLVWHEDAAILDSWEERFYIREDIMRQLESTVARLTKERDEAVAELKNIRDANPNDWDIETVNQFKDWAQNRARHTLARIEQADKEAGS